jgi:(S)-3,5-dihydroxyphenylglycine transaminase
MSISNRKRLLGIAKTASLRIVEDNAYGYFYFGSKPQPSLLSLDQDGLVIFLGSFAKSIFPGMRMAFIAMRDGSVNGVTSRALVDNLTLTKSFTTLNTSPILQAMVGGVLIKEGYSLFKYTDRSRRFYRSNRDLMIACLENEFGKAVERKKKYADLTWSIPEGGFFITIELSRPVSTPELLKCAGEYGVIWMPVSLFSLNPEPARLIRLAFSSQSADRIVSGIEKLARFIKCNDIGCVSAIYDK